MTLLKNILNSFLYKLQSNVFYYRLDNIFTVVNNIKLQNNLNTLKYLYASVVWDYTVNLLMDILLNSNSYKKDNFSNTDKLDGKFIYTTLLNYKSFRVSLLDIFYKYLQITKNIINIIIYNIKWILLAGFISIIYFFFSLFYIQIDFTKQLAIWYLSLIMYYLLMSAFNTFLNKYRYGKFTSAIQRFWKRTGMIFWLIEGFLFLLFFYYFLNSSQEPIYMFDYSSLNQELLIQLKSSYKNMILLSLAIYLSFILLLNLNFYVYYQNILILSLISLIIFYTLYIESYQFVYIINIFADKEWVFDDIKQLWVLEVEQNNLRVKQQYFVLCLIAKYWHFIFIFISWFFFLVKSLEISKISITLLGYNTQNLLILYLLNLLCLCQWAKFVFKKFLEITYYWFFTQYDEKFFINFVVELWNTLVNYLNINDNSQNVSMLNFYSNSLYFSSEISLWKYII